MNFGAMLGSSLERKMFNWSHADAMVQLPMIAPDWKRNGVIGFEKQTLPRHPMHPIAIRPVAGQGMDESNKTQVIVTAPNGNEIPIALEPNRNILVGSQDSIFTHSPSQMLLNQHTLRLPMSAQEWLTAVWDILRGTVGYIVWNFEDLRAQIIQWDGTWWGLLRHTALIWRVLVTAALAIGLSQAGPILNAMMQLLTLLWDIVSVTFRVVVGTVEELWSVWERMIQTITSF
jgi:hypothetical protein